jgi:carbonic anhydrase
MTTTEQLLQNANAYAEGFDKGDLPCPRQARRRARLHGRRSTLRILGLTEDAHVIRNAGGVVSDDAIRSLAISQNLLGTEEIILIHHTDAGCSLTDDELAEARAGDRRAADWHSPFSDVEGTCGRASNGSGQPFIPGTDRVGLVYEVETGLREVS